MTIAINAATNSRLYADATSIASDLIALQQKVTLYKERLYLIGIPSHPLPSVTGFVDAADLTVADMGVAVGLVVDFSEYMTLSRIQACAQLLRNVPAS